MFLSSVVYYFRDLLKSANMAFVQHKTGMKKFHVERDACRRNVDGKIVVLLSSVVYYFGGLLKSANMAFVRHKTFIGL